jgi:biotin synthase
MNDGELILRGLERGERLSHEQWPVVFSEAFDPFRQNLFELADRVRRKYVGDHVFLRGLVEFSNYCSCRCAYCGISAENPHLVRYRMTSDEILETIGGGFRLGYRSFVLQSGEDPSFSKDRLCEIFSAIKREFPVALTLSIGEWPREDLMAFRAIGVDRFLLRIETADPVLFAALHPDSMWEDRHRCLVDIKELGFQVGSGVLIGLPGQTPGHLQRDLEYLIALRPEMVGIGPFIPHPQTPLQGAPGGTLSDCLTFLALLRIFLPDAYLPATTAMGSIDPSGRQKALRAGANVLMPNVSPLENRAKYELYPGKIGLSMDNDAADAGQCSARQMVEGLGRRVSLDHGHIQRRVFPE